jgi:hypothetical protein
MEQEIKKALDSLVKGINKEIETEYSDVIDKLLASENFDWTNPDNTNVTYFYETRKFIPHLLKRVYPNVDGNTLHKITFIYEQYDFLDDNIRPLVDMGTGCCADRTRWLIRQYLIMCLGKELSEIPCRNTENHKYCHPDFGTINEWMTYIESLYHMYYKGFSAILADTYNNLNRKKEDIQKVILEENRKINSFYASLPEKLNSLVNSRQITADEFSKVDKINVVERLMNDIINDTVTDEKILKVIKE